ncbi:hypothetical protein FS842_009678 [Serendipita sp. 407]|nr:hypothetical protein FS842_009678 [Serendipita sp. 407]
MLDSLRTTLKLLLEALIDVKASRIIEGEANVDAQPEHRRGRPLHVTPPLPRPSSSGAYAHLRSMAWFFMRRKHLGIHNSYQSWIVDPRFIAGIGLHEAQQWLRY